MGEISRWIPGESWEEVSNEAFEVRGQTIVVVIASNQAYHSVYDDITNHISKIRSSTDPTGLSSREYRLCLCDGRNGTRVRAFSDVPLVLPRKTQGELEG